MMNDIQFIEKPDWISWDEVHEVIWNAHERNREKGIIMSYPSLPGDEIKSRIEGKGKLFVAIDNNKVVGTLALIKKKGNKWYCPGEYGYLCFGAVLKEYSGQGVYRSLYQVAEKNALDMGFKVLTRDTNEHNARMLKITKQEGYHFVEYRPYKDHFNIVRAKWLNKCPYPLFYIKMRFIISKVSNKLRYKMNSHNELVKRFCI